LPWIVPVLFSAADNGAYFFRQVAPVFGPTPVYFYYRCCICIQRFEVEKRGIILKWALILAVLKGIMRLVPRGCENWELVVGFSFPPREPGKWEYGSVPELA
jgi:hypothetical protein